MAETALEYTVEIAAPPEEVFEWLVDRSRVVRWCEALGVPESFADSLPERSELRVGHRSETKTQTRPSMMSTETVEATAVTEVTSYDPPQSYSTRSEHPDHETADEYVVEPSGSGSRLRHRRVSSYRGIAGEGISLASKFGLGAGMKIFNRYAEREFRRSLDTLKDLIESRG